MELSQLNRRNFLKATAVTGAAAFSGMKAGLVQAQAAPTDSAAPKADETKIVSTCCRACIFNCGVLAHVRNGRVVKIEGNPNHPESHGTLCSKGLSGIGALYHPNRLKYPMLRAGKRGENKWRRISWEEAIDIIAKKLMEVRAKYGAESVFLSTGGGGNPHFRMIARFCNTFGTPNWYEPGCAQCYLPRTLAFGMMYGGPSTSVADENTPEIFIRPTKMKNMVCWGTDPSNSCPSGGGTSMVELRAEGCKTVSVDPRFVPDAARADVWLPIRPGSDVALMLAWIKYIIDHDLYDHDFVMKWTNLPYLVNTETKFFAHGETKDIYQVWDKKTNKMQPLVYPWNDAYDVDLDCEKTVDGVTYKTGFRLLRERCEEWTIEKACEVCWLDPKKVIEAINIFADGPGGMSLGVATDQNPNSVEAAMCCVILNSLMGYVEKPGCLMQRKPGCGIPHNSLVTRCERLLPEGMLAKKLGSTEYKGLLSWDAGQPHEILQAILTGKPYQLRVWLERSGNKFVVNADVSQWEKAMQKLEFIVHMYMYMTSFSMYADLCLPTNEWLETDSLNDCDNVITARQQVVHLWETANETDIWSWILIRCAELGHETCKKAMDPEFMGKDLPLWHNQDELLTNVLKPIIGMTWKELKEKGSVEFMPFDKWNTYYVYLNKDKNGQPQGFRTPSRKMELYGDNWITLSRTGAPYAKQPLPPASHDYDPLPFYMEPEESPLKPIAKEYPFVITNGRLPMYHHGTLRNNPFLREIYPVPMLWINPDDAKKYGIADGDWTYIESRRGRITGKALLTESMHPGVLYMERFWNPETLGTDAQGWKDMSYNVLSKGTPPFNEKIGTHTLRGIQVKISKAPGAPKGIWYKPEDFKPWVPQAVAPTDPVKYR